jgi:S-adenosylmethionine synthetase
VPMRHLFTSESVTMGHPDKVADQISDAVVDAVYAQDPRGRVAVETLVTTNLCILAGEVTTTAKVDYEQVAREAIRSIGYTDGASGFAADSAEVLVRIHEQSPDIAMGVDESKDKEQGAGDQGLMFGYATRETPELMPLPIQLANRLVMCLADLREKRRLPYLRPDGKTQVTVAYEDGRPAFVHTVVVSSHHAEDVTLETIRRDLVEHCIKPSVPAQFLSPETRILINPTGRFAVGGPAADTGVTGRKIIVDTYGGRGHHGGGAFSGKDPSKVDRSASYNARYIAKNVVASGLADVCEVQLSYAIGVAEPLAICCETNGTGKRSEEELVALIWKHFPLKPKAIIDHLNLRRPIYRKTARHGHFGRNDPDFTWELTDKADGLRRAAGLA